MRVRLKDLDPDRALRDVLLQELFRPTLDAARNETGADECNLLCLAPATWGISWMSSSGSPKPRQSRLPEVNVPDCLPHEEQMHTHLFGRAADLIQRHDDLAYTWAQKQLGKGIFPLTGHGRCGKASSGIWCPTSGCTLAVGAESRAPTFFQTALEWAASAGDDSRVFEDEFLTKHRNAELKVTRCFGVDAFANRPGLVGRDNYLQFLAEHIRILGQASVDGHELAAPTIKSRFLPLRCLGQWRASFDLKSISSIDPRNTAMASREPDMQRLGVGMLVPATERQLSYAVLSAFRQAIDAPNHRRSPLVTELRSLLPFSSLWWSKEIFFVQNGQTRARLAREDDGQFHLDDAPTAKPPHRPGNSFISRLDVSDRPNESWLIMDLAKTDLEPQMQGSWGFDEIHYRVPLLDRNINSDEWLRMEETVHTVVRRTLRSRYYSIDAQEMQEAFNRLTYLSHGTGNALNAAHNRLHSLIMSIDETTEDSFHRRKELLGMKAAVVSRQLAEAQGLAYFARSGLKELADGPPKTWRVEPGEPFWKRPEILEAMRTVIAYFIGAYEPQDGYDDVPVVFLIDGVRQDYTLRGLAEIARTSTELSLPPFSRKRLHDIRGGAPIFLVTLGLAEILRNARNHLVSSWAEYADTIPESAPRLLIALDANDRCDVTVLVCGLAREGHNLRSLSLERIIRAERSLPPALRLMVSEQAVRVPPGNESLLHHPGSGFERTLVRWRLLGSKAIAAFSSGEGSAT